MCIVYKCTANLSQFHFEVNSSGEIRININIFFRDSFKPVLAKKSLQNDTSLHRWTIVTHLDNSFHFSYTIPNIVTVRPFMVWCFHKNSRNDVCSACIDDSVCYCSSSYPVLTLNATLWCTYYYQLNGNFQSKRLSFSRETDSLNEWVVIDFASK